MNRYRHVLLVLSKNRKHRVIPAKGGIQRGHCSVVCPSWIPAFAGTTDCGLRLLTMGLMLLSLFASPVFADIDAPKVSFEKIDGRIQVSIGDQTVAEYVYEDPAIPRPYFSQVKTLDGVPVTRPNPPDPEVNKGNDDHPTFHPGLWLAFGDLSGNDFWRNQARVRHVRFADPFEDRDGINRFTVVNEYRAANGSGDPVCEETCTYTVAADQTGYFILGQSVFRSGQADFTFGDQEEMGFGIRMNTPLTVKFGSGRIFNSEGGENEEGTWGKAAKWCAASGMAGGKRIGLVVMPDPANFRSSWFHSRDYGLIVANPFGRKAMTGPKDKDMGLDSTRVPKGAAFRIGFGVYVYSVPGEQDPDLEAVYATSLKLAGDTALQAKP